MRIWEFIELFKKIAEFIKLRDLPGILNQVATVFDGLPPLDQPGALEVRIQEVLNLAVTIAKATKTETDDKIANGILTIWADSNLRTIFVGIVEWIIQQQADEPIRLPAVDTSPFTLVGIDPELLLQIAGLVAKLIELFKLWRS